MNEPNKKSIKKQLFTSVACLLLLIIMLLSSTLAWFTDDAYTTNTMTAGKISISQDTDSWGALVMMPSQTYPTTVLVTNTGNQDCYVRTLFAFEDDSTGMVLSKIETIGREIIIPGVNTDLREDKIQFTATKDGKTVLYTVGFYVHEAKVVPGGTVTPLTDVKLDGTAANAWTDAVGVDYSLLVLTQACQVTGLGDVAATALVEAFTVVDSENCAMWFKQVLGEGFETAVYPVHIDP